MKRFGQDGFFQRWHKAPQVQEGVVAAIHKSQAVAEFTLDGHITAANANFLATMGYSEQEVVGQHHRLFMDPEMAAAPEYAAFWQRLAAGTWEAGCYRRIAKDGRDVWLQASYNPILDRKGRPFKVVKFATDVTEQQQRNADAAGQLAAISKVHAIIEFALDGTILNANDLFLRTLGYSLHEIVGKHHRMFVQPQERDSPRYAEFWRQLGRGVNDVGQYLRIGKNGRQVWIEASYNPILDANGVPFKVVKYATDITHRVAATETLRAAVKSLAASAERAGQVDGLSRKASAVAEAGGETVRAVVASMEAISASSSHISGIIGVMDKIAFQTNILALNAAVEAARAGDQGRSFAVVADEVRSLAQNSAAAAKEIAQLIHVSAGQIQRGEEQVRDAGSTMEKIVASSRQVSEIMREVVQATRQQSASLQDLTEELTTQDSAAAAAPASPLRLPSA